MGTFHNVTLPEVDSLLRPEGFSLLALSGHGEYVYGKRVDCDGVTLSMRVYTGIKRDGNSRELGADAMRVTLVHKKADGTIVGVKSTARVNRTLGWAGNLANRIANMRPNHAHVSPSGWVYVN